MSLLGVVLTLVVIGVLMTLLNKYCGEYIGPPWMKLINIVVIVAVVLWLLGLFGLFDYLTTVQFPTMRRR